MRLRLFCLLALFLADPRRPAEAQLASMLKDIGTFEEGGSSNPEFLGSFAGWTYFSAEAPGIGRELWRTDGTPEGTTLLKDTCPGDCYSYYKLLARTPGALYLAQSTSSFQGPWVGLFAARAEGLVRISTPPGVSPAFGSLNEPGATALLGDRLIFGGLREDGTPVLLSTNATPDGSEMLRDFPESNGLFGMTTVGSQVLLWNQPVMGPPELFATDGTPAGTRFVIALDVVPLEAAIAFGGSQLLFAAQDASGVEVWRTDGSAQGTRRLTDLIDPQARVWSMAATPNGAFFYVEDASLGQELWSSDGTSAGTHPVSLFGFHAPFGPDQRPYHLAVVGARAFFLATDGIAGVSLWSASLSAASATELVDVCSYSCLDGAWITSVGAQLFFLREQAESGLEVWTSDGTPGGTRLLNDSCPAPSCNGGGFPLASSGDTLVYGAMRNEQYQSTVFVARAPWITAQSLYDPVRGGPLLHPYTSTTSLVDGSKIYFGARDSLWGIEPWVSEGTPATSFVLADISGPLYSDSAPGGFAESNGTVAFFIDVDGSLADFWLTDGTPTNTRPAVLNEHICTNRSAGIRPIADRFLALSCAGGIQALDPVSNQVELIPTGDCYSSIGSGALGGIYVAAIYCDESPQIWRSNGTAAGTALAIDLDAGFNISSAFTRVGDSLLLTGGSAEHRIFALSASMTSLTPISAPGVAPDSRLVPDGETLGFFSHDARIWRTDGTAVGTFSIGPTYGDLRLRGAVRSATGYDLLVQADWGREEVWASDGTTAGTVVRAAFAGTYSSPADAPLVRATNHLFFVLPSYEEGAGLWVLDDGSSLPQRLIAVQLGSSVPQPDSLAAFGTSAYFSACDEAHGCELWSSDGTLGGTRLIHDIAPGVASSSPYALAVLGSTLYFAANDHLHGFEPWTLELDGGPFCRQNVRTLCLESGRFQVTSRWRNFSHQSGDATAVPISGDTGYFWFFDEDNVEMILKLIDGSGYNGHHWVYYGALTNVEYTFTVTDSETGAAKRYFNPAARFASSGDITAFGPQGAHARGGPAEAMTRGATPPEVSLATFSAPQGLPGACVPTATQFCILNNRFAVTATWRDFAGNSGTANAGTLTDDTGYLWFFNEANVEVVLKMVDAGAFNGHFWVYYGALSNIEYTLTVTDTVAGGPPRIYRNALGQFGSFGDIEAFPAN